MARVVCDELARQAYDSSTDVFVKRLIQLRELSEDWEQIDGVKASNTAASSQTKKEPQVCGDMPSDNGASDNDDDNEGCDVSMVCDEIPSTSDYGYQRQPRPVSRKLDFHCLKYIGMFWNVQTVFFQFSKCYLQY